MGHTLPLRLLVALLALLPSGAGAVDDLEREVTRRGAEIAKAREAYEEAVANADERALKAYVRIAQKQVRSGDLTGVMATWKEVLRVDRGHAEARAFFTTLGTLDQVLAELEPIATDLLGNPLVATGSGRGLLFGATGALVPDGTVLSASFTARTTELLVGRMVGDGVLFEEGGSSNGQALGVVGDQVTYLVRSGGLPTSITARIDRAAARTHLAAQFDAGQMRLWVDSTLVAQGIAGYTAIPGHAGGGLGLGDSGNSGNWTTSCQFLLIAFRLTGAARYAGQARPDGRMAPDQGTLLAVTPEMIAGFAQPSVDPTARGVRPAAIRQLVRPGAGGESWTVHGEVRAP